MKIKKSNWGLSLLLLLFSIGFFLIFKNFLPEKIFPEIAKLDTDHIVVDEWMESAMKDTLQNDSIPDLSQDIITEKENQKDSIPVREETIDASVTTAENQMLSEEEKQFFLEYFYRQLFNLELNPDAEKVRIAYFGDSMTDGDLIVQDVRRKFQEKYGGRGVGFVPIVSESATSRASIVHRFSKDWTTYTFMKKYAQKHAYAVSGMVSYADSLSQPFLKYSAGVNAGNNLMPNPVLYYGQSTNDSAKVRMITKTDTTFFELNPDQLLNKLSLKTGILSKFDLDFYKADSIPFYGVNFDMPTGVQVDNFSKRGNSGLPLTQLNWQLMRQFQNDLHYDLIILHFGTNVLNSNSFNYGWYQSRMKKVVNYMRSAFPESSILVISIADKATKYDNEMKTDSAVNYLRAVQQKYAAQEKTGFIDLYALMGGEGSMVKWVEEEPAKANKDYMHFNSLGARKVGELIFNKIEEGYREYKIRRENEEADKQMETDSTSKPNHEEKIENEIQKDSTKVL